MNKQAMKLLEQADAVIFDMDGLLIDSEPFWKIAEKKIFGRYGLTLTDEQLREVMGFRLSEVVQHWYTYQPWPEPNFEQTENAILSCVEELIIAQALPMPGVYETIQMVNDRRIKMAVASSSALRLIQAVVSKLQIQPYLSLLHSAEYEPYGKPHPGIFITTARELGVEPSRCLVFEDSINGVIAAKAARMKCIAVPEVATRNNPAFAIADVKLNSLTELFA
jgi:HAD superfamily hydrolase (TIGR01509 family)